ncbi:MAG: hypothetical protein NUV54_03170 [Candidatus Taylorbacteria bacterium]|nr:hypothetical protein [Candidatus Taylorbacteria bacterium]
MAEKKHKKKRGGSNITSTEWGMVIFALLLIDLIEIGLDALFGIGAFANPFIDLLVNMTWATYLYLRGVNLKSAKNLATLLIGGGLQMLPGFDGFWAIEGTVIMFITKFEDKIKKETGVDVERLAAAGEAGAPERAADASEDGAESSRPEGDDGRGEGGGMSDDYADAMGAESDESAQGSESDNPYGDESEEEKSERMKGDEGDGEHEIEDADAEDLAKQADGDAEEGEEKKDEDKKSGGSRNKGGGGLFGGRGRKKRNTGNDLDLRKRYRSPEEIAEDDRLQAHSNLVSDSLLAVADPLAEKKKEEKNDQRHFSA